MTRVQTCALPILHGLRHTLRNNIKPASLYELSVLLRRLASDEAWWAEWNRRYDYDFRLLQAVAFRFANAWFDSPRAPFELPPQIEQWFDQAGWSPIDSLFEPNKETLRLHLMLLPRWRDRAHVIQDRLLPLKIPHEKGRARHHLETALRLLLKKSHRPR